jgi:hypothetical protein
MAQLWRVCAVFFFGFPFCPERAMNRHQPNTKLIKFCRGEGGVGRRGGPLRSPASWSLCSPDGLCQPNGGRCVLHPVGTRGGVGWMRGPCACPRGDATGWPHGTQTTRQATRTSTRPPPFSTSTPCPYRMQVDLPNHSPIRLAKIIRECEHTPHPRATIKALPSPHHPPSPLRIIRPVVSFPGLG